MNTNYVHAVYDGVGGGYQDDNTRDNWLRLKWFCATAHVCLTNGSVSNWAAPMHATRSVFHVFSNILWVTLVGGYVHSVVSVGCVLCTVLLFTSSGVGAKSWVYTRCLSRVFPFWAPLPVLRVSLARRSLLPVRLPARDNSLESAWNPCSFTTARCHCRW